MLSDELANADDLAASELRQALIRTQRQLAAAKLRTDELVDATIAAAKDATLAFGPVPAVPAPRRDARRKRGEVALWHLTDWQGAKVTPSYNSEVMRERVMRFAEKAVSITNIQRADHPVKECHIAFGGDMVEGLFNFTYADLSRLTARFTRSSSMSPASSWTLCATRWRTMSA